MDYLDRQDFTPCNTGAHYAVGTPSSATVAVTGPECAPGAVGGGRAGDVSDLDAEDFVFYDSSIDDGGDGM